MTLSKLVQFLTRLEEAKIHFQLGRIRDQTICVQLAVPGERWEVEFFGDGDVEVERFRSDGTLAGEEALAELFARFSD